ncbi:hypothetical protein Goshw_020893 [Gossypium schwendimanii]|uniref:Uncharacterized protein n=1 Tax=Gossypium schwendimanii TaxID=34291 RepID=A0A7J9N2L2_GOSSC|nr:hypothetical protein [Gossypium schwendimanii]
MDRCKSLKLLPELLPYLLDLNVHDCISLEKVSFADQNLYQFDLLGDESDGVFCMLLCNCFNLNQESTNDIEANDRLKIGSLAKEWAVRYGRKYLGDTLPTAVGGYEKFKSTISFLDASKSEKCMGDHESDIDATEMRPAGTKRIFSHDGEEGDGGPKLFQ